MGSLVEKEVRKWEFACFQTGPLIIVEMPSINKEPQREIGVLFCAFQASANFDPMIKGIVVSQLQTK
jgi:hypothetical protein